MSPKPPIEISETVFFEVLKCLGSDDYCIVDDCAACEYIALCTQILDGLGEYEALKENEK